MNPYDRHQLTVRELSAHYAERCPPALTLFLYCIIGAAALCVIPFFLFAFSL